MPRAVKTEDAEIRDPHAELDPASRAVKAQKILHLLRDRVLLEGADVLEVGTGSGVIAETLKQQVGGEGDVWAVDVVDQRLDRDAVRFLPVAGTTLPFPDASFDLVISNHVIEHVGRLPDQHDHLQEIARVLRSRGWLYLAMPNRWTPMEPHFKLPFLSWLPERRRSAYVRIMNRGAVYDCRPLTRRQLVELFEAHGFEYADLSRDALRIMLDLERPSAPAHTLMRLASRLFPLARPILPSFIFLARRGT